MAYTKKVTTSLVEENVEINEEDKKVITKPEKKVVREYSSDDVIPCRSVTYGELLYVGKKTGELYRWSAYGDVCDVAYADLLSLKTSKSQFLYDPLFMVDDEDIIENPKWADIKKMYESMISVEEIAEVLSMDNASFRRLVENVPVGMKNAIITEVSTQIENGTFDSLQKVKILDEICNTDLACLL